MKITVLSMALILCLAVCLRTAAESDSSAEPVITVNGTGISIVELERTVQVDLFLAALHCAKLGYGINIVDPLEIEDRMDKTVVALENQIVIRALAAERGVELDEKDLAWADREAREEWQDYRAVVNSDNGMAFLPAGDYVPADNPEETVTRYMASFGLTEEELYRRSCGRILGEKLRADYTAGMEGDEDALLMAFADWQLEVLSAAEITEDADALQSLALRLQGK